MSDALGWLAEWERSLALQEWEWARTQAAFATIRARDEALGDNDDNKALGVNDD